MNNAAKSYLDNLRHSCAHLLAAAVLELYPKAKLAIGPSIENGFYYDIDFGNVKVEEKDLSKIESKMHELVNKWSGFSGKKISLASAKKQFKDNPYKLELIEEFSKEGKTLSTYQSGEFTDLCRGGHIDNPKKELQHFKLLSIAGAYWRGSEKNKMLTRIYGTCWPTKKELDEYLNKLELAKERDHRKLGKELDLFAFADEVGPGLPLWTPKGTIIRDELESWAKETEKKWGYVRVATPHIAKGQLYEISGHLPYYKDDMYPPMQIEGENYYLKGMNCPHHHMIYLSRPRSYKELPLRLAEYGTVYRNEQSGSLFGLLRVRSIAQNDSHIYCTESQAEAEFLDVLKLHEYYYKILGLTKDDYYIVLGLPDESKRDKYHGDKKLWDKAEKIMRSAIGKSGIRLEEDIGGAAFYGPKIDFNIKSSTGREFGASTNQLDLYMPMRFKLIYTDQDGQEKYCVVIHRAPLGSHERFIGFLIEHFAGAFPVWLAPVQVKVLPITDRNMEYANKVLDELLSPTSPRLRGTTIRAELDSRNETLQAKIRDAQLEKVPYMLIIGDKEQSNDKVAVRTRVEKDLGQISLEKFITLVKNKIVSKSLDL